MSRSGISDTRRIVNELPASVRKSAQVEARLLAQPRKFGPCLRRLVAPYRVRGLFAVAVRDLL